jgi:hypothetical protein
LRPVNKTSGCRRDGNERFHPFSFSYYALRTFYFFSRREDFALGCNLALAWWNRISFEKFFSPKKGQFQSTSHKHILIARMGITFQPSGKLVFERRPGICSEDNWVPLGQRCEGFSFENTGGPPLGWFVLPLTGQKPLQAWTLRHYFCLTAWKPPIIWRPTPVGDAIQTRTSVSTNVFQMFKKTAQNPVDNTISIR